ncbi:MAG: hypothetical protein NT075_22880 [Chloroflexi bacterium]|nr:hypothetical protein [Chloroflexota bacterium]
MKRKHLLQIGLAVLALIVLTSVALARSNSMAATATLAETVRQATIRFKDVEAAKKAGYGLLHGCVAGPQEGAMGIHFANGDLVGDGEVDAQHPEALLYEPKDGKLQLVGVEYVVLADSWNAKHKTPPVLMGQLFNYASSPNRYGLPAFYELHVWAWQNNPSGMFADWNPSVSCEAYTGDPAMQSMGH